MSSSLGGEDNLIFRYLPIILNYQSKIHRKNPVFCVLIPRDDPDKIFKGSDGVVWLWNLSQINQAYGF